MAIKRVKAPRWAEKEKSGGRIEEAKCRFCHLQEAPLHTTKDLHALTVFYPYFPEHVMLLPRTHRESLRRLDLGEYEALVGAMEKVLRGAESERHAPLLVGVNEGLVAAQTLPHLHAHVYPAAPGKPARLLHPHAVYRDPLSRVILIQRASEGPVPFAGQGGRLDEKRGAYVIPFKSFKDLARPAHFRWLQEYLGELEASFDALRKDPEKVDRLPGLSPARRESYKRLLRERTGQGFGLHWGVQLGPKGQVLFTVIPRATVISLQDTRRRIASIEVFTGAHPEREGVSGPYGERWKRREARFYEAVKRWLSG
jgi:histidine triad (HIT) family protein